MRPPSTTTQPSATGGCATGTTQEARRTVAKTA
jgi:hypothetical protein